VISRSEMGSGTKSKVFVIRRLSEGDSRWIPLERPASQALGIAATNIRLEAGNGGGTRLGVSQGKD
jgi:hypothetical protein